MQRRQILAADYHGVEGPEDVGAPDGEGDLRAEASQDLKTKLSRKFADNFFNFLRLRGV
jgi:hypothetical protein